jgi:hypothetical protein
MDRIKENMTAVRAFILALFLLLTASLSWGQEFYVYGGGVENTSTDDQDQVWGLAYMQGVGEHAMVSFTYLNEGHLPDHHRDGYAVQFWGRTTIIDRRLSLAAGIGPYAYCDTASGQIESYNTHGWGGMFSLAATWYAESRWLFQVRGNWIGTTNSFNSLSVTGGIGYQLDAPPTPGPRTVAPRQNERTTNNEITLFVGESTLNRLESRHTAAEAVEYRRGLTRHIDWTIGFLNEGSSIPLERYGVTSQFWLVRAFFDDHLALGVGLGPYLAHDEYRGRQGSTTVNALIGFTGSYRFSSRWAVRLTWDRVATNYDQDTDVLLGGLTYRF